MVNKATFITTVHGQFYNMIQSLPVPFFKHAGCFYDLTLECPVSA